MEKKRLTYRDAGVDIDAQSEALRRIKDFVKGTRTPGVLADLGSFGGLFRPQLDGFDEAVLVASADGVGTKLKAAFLSGVHDTVGRDLVNHCVNDILVQGAKPLFFLDYIATGRLDPRVLASIVEGLANGCRENGCALLGGETAEMPGFYAHGEYDVAGFIVGIVDRPRLLDGSAVRHGDLLVGLPSSGMHTNGFSLARKIFFDVEGLGIDDRVDELGETVGQILLAEHKSYLPALSGVIDRLHALAHITGGGLTDNLPRVLPAGCTARVDRGRWEIPKLFDYMAHRGGVAEDEMFRTFNMGIGMVAIVSPDQAGALESHLDALGERHVRIGSVVPGEGGVLYA
ncbi:MAG: phosphoribosylformylglycinamidine cyclo-ligase [Acidobacteria bacterium]|nr:MAG: phosphoribosylformylglycinamidine cyclo-ligase [Acidobacteriota bacterium]